MKDEMKNKIIKSPTKQKILLLLLSGAALGLTRSYHKQRSIIKNLPRAWRQINKDHLWRTIKEFQHDKLIDWRENPDGTIDIVLTENGVRTASRFDPDRLNIPTPTYWDKRWRMVIYDIPNKKRAGSNALREKLREIGFKEWQKSVFLHPFPCKDQIDFIIELFNLRPYVRYAEVINPTNEAELKLHFKLF